MHESDRTPAAVAERFIDCAFTLLMDHHHQQICEVALTLTQAQALRVLGREPLSTGELARRLAISAPAVTQMIDRLSRKRLIERRPAAGDRRSIALSLSKSGRRLVDGFRDRRNQIFDEALGRLGAGERAVVIESLGKLAEALEAAEPRRRFAAPPPTELVPRTAVSAAPASNSTGQAGAGLRGKKLRMEWD